MILCRERPHPGACFPSSKRLTGGATNRSTPTPTSPLGSQRFWKPGTASKPGPGQNSSREGTSLGRFPSHQFSINQAWLALTMIAADLVAQLRLLALENGDLAKAEPKALRHRFLHVPARLILGARPGRLRMPKHGLGCRHRSRVRPHRGDAATGLNRPVRTHRMNPTNRKSSSASR